MFSEIYVYTDGGYSYSPGCRETALRKGGNYIYSLKFSYTKYNEEDISRLKKHFAFNLFIDRINYDGIAKKIEFIFKNHTPIKVSKFFITLFRVYLYYHVDYYKFVHDVFYYRSAGYKYNFYPLVHSWDYGRVTFALYFLESFMFFDEDYFMKFVNSENNSSYYSTVGFPYIENVENLLKDFIKKVKKPSALKYYSVILNKVYYFMERGGEEEW